MSNFRCETCGAIYLDTSKGHVCNKENTTAEVIRNLNNRNKCLQELIYKQNKYSKIIDKIEELIEYKCNICRSDGEIMPCDYCFKKEILNIIHDTQEVQL